MDLEKKNLSLAYVTLGRDNDSCQKINLIAPDHLNIDQVTCVLFAAGAKVQEQKVAYRDEIVRLYQFRFNDLEDGVTYNYVFYTSDGDLDLGDGLQDEDLKFKYWKNLSSASSVIHMSCNGVHNYQRNKKDPWGMWIRLENEIKAMSEAPQLLILGGDQYYQDCLEDDWMDKLTVKDFDKNYKAFKRASVINALRHMSHLSYRKIMAQIPSVAMMDDHDITDGAGGREDFYLDKTFEMKEAAKNFCKVQLEIFELLQASRNPVSISKKSNQAYSFVLDLGATALVAADMRSEKNSRRCQLMEKDSQELFLNTLRELRHKNILLLLPIVPLRNSLKWEKALVPLAKSATDLSKIIPNKFMLNWLKDGLKFFGDMYDDLNDSLSSECNKEFLIDLLKVVGMKSKRGTAFTILSGDIHTGGTVEMVVEHQGINIKIPILISSPIGYEPMKVIIEAVLREKGVITFEYGGIKINAVTNAFTTNRNFMQIFPNKLVVPDSNAVLIYDEDIPGSRKCIINGWKPNLTCETVKALDAKIGSEIVEVRL